MVNKGLNLDVEKIGNLVSSAIKNGFLKASRLAVKGVAIADDIISLQSLKHLNVSFGDVKIFQDPFDPTMSLIFFVVPRNLRPSIDKILSLNGKFRSIFRLVSSRFSHKGVCYGISIPTSLSIEYRRFIKDVIYDSSIDDVSKVISIFHGVKVLGKPDFSIEEQAEVAASVASAVAVSAAAAFASSKELISGAISSAVAATVTLAANSAIIAEYYSRRSNYSLSTYMNGRASEGNVRNLMLNCLHDSLIFFPSSILYTLKKVAKAVGGIALALGSSAAIGAISGVSTKLVKKQIRNRRIFNSYGKLGLKKRLKKLPNGKTIELTKKELKAQILSKELSVPAGVQSILSANAVASGSSNASAALKSIQDGISTKIVSSKLSDVVSKEKNILSQSKEMWKKLSEMKNYDDSDLKSKVVKIRSSLGDF